MQKLNFPKTIIISTLLISFTVISGLFIYGHLEIKKARNLPVEFVEPVENNDNQEPKPVEPIEPVELEIYEAEIFIEAKWGEGEGEVGISRTSEQEVEDAGPIYGPQSFDISDETGHLYLLDSINERILEYDENGKYLRDFPIACGGTGDVRVSPNGECLYVFSWRCEAVYKYDTEGEFLESYPLSKEVSLGCLGTNGLAFDEDGNIMLDIEIENYIKWGRFYQIGKNGDEWKENYYKGFISKDGKEYYNLSQINSRTRSVKIKDKEGELLKKFLVKLSQPAYVYYYGCDDKKNTYLNIAFEHGSMDEGFHFDDFVWKYNRRGGLLAKFDLMIPLRENYNIINNKFLPNFSYAWAPLTNKRIDSEGSVYRMFTFENEGLKIYKYSIDKNLTAMGYIKNVYEKNEKRYLDINYVQWLMSSDGSCSFPYEAESPDIPECNPSGFLVVEKDLEIETFEISEDVEIVMCSYGNHIEWDQHIKYKNFENIFKKNNEDYRCFREDIPFIVEINKDNKVVTITEQYIP